MKVVFFYDNLEVFKKISKGFTKNFTKYKIKEIDKLKDIVADFLILETPEKGLDKLINQLEVLSSIPYIVITKNISKKYHALHLLDILDYTELNNLAEKVNNCFKKVKQEEFSIFEITDVMQMISMEKKTIALRVIGDGKVGSIAFENGMPIYSKAIIDKQVEYGIESAFKIISWDNIKFKLIRIIGEIPNNMEIDLTNLLMGAMQYKDEIDYIKEDNEKNKRNKKDNHELDCESIINTLSKISGYIGISIFKNNKEICVNHINNSYIKNKYLKTYVNKITKLVKTMLKDIGFKKFDSILLATETSSAIIEHDEKNKLDVILFLEKNSNMALSKVIIKKIMLGIL